MIALDTNLLVYAHLSGTPEHKRASRALLDAIDDTRGAGIPYPCVAEFWSVVTAVPQHRASRPAEAEAFLAGLWRVGVDVWSPGPTFPQLLAEVAVDRRAKGRDVFDLQIALLARNSGATEIWTSDRGFPALPGLRVVNPLA